MKRTCVELLACNECQGPVSVAEVRHETETEIREGVLCCVSCGKQFPVSGGICDFLIENSTISKELAAHKEVILERERPPEIFGEEWVGSLPFPKSMGSPQLDLALEGERDSFFKCLPILLAGGRRILDVGVGTGWTSAILAERGFEVIAIDVDSRKFTGLATADIFIEHRKVYFERIRTAMERLPFRDGVFDWVHTVGALHHTCDLKKALREFSRVLCEGGSVLCAAEPMDGFLRPGPHSEDRAKGFNENSFTYREYKRGLRECGLKPTFILFQDLLYKRVGRYFGPYRNMKGPLVQWVNWLLLRTIGLPGVAILARKSGSP